MRNSSLRKVTTSDLEIPWIGLYIGIDRSRSLGSYTFFALPPTARPPSQRGDGSLMETSLSFLSVQTFFSLSEAARSSRRGLHWFYDLRFVYSWQREHPQDSETHTWRCTPPMPEILTKVSLAHSYPGFFRTGNLPRATGEVSPVAKSAVARFSNWGYLAEIFT